MRALRNIAIIALLALIVAVVPGGGNAAAAIVAADLDDLPGPDRVAGAAALPPVPAPATSGLTERQRALFVGSLGAIVLMIAGGEKLTSTGGGLVVWFGVIAFAVISIIKVWGDSRSSY